MKKENTVKKTRSVGWSDWSLNGSKSHEPVPFYLGPIPTEIELGVRKYLKGRG